MRSSKFVPLCGAVLAGLVGAAAAQFGTPTPPVERPGTAPLVVAHLAGPCRASKLVDTQVVDARNEKIATLKDLAVDESGVIVAIVKRAGGDLAGVPLELLMPATDARDAAQADRRDVQQFVLKAATEKLLSAPYINDVANIDATWVARVHEHFSGSYPPSSGAQGVEQAMQRSGAARADAPDATAAATPGKPICTDQFVGKDVNSTAGDGLGRIEDFAVNVPQARLAYVVISTSSLPGTSGTLHGVPWSGLSVDTTGKTMILAMDKAALEKAPGIDLDRLPPQPDLSVSETASRGPGPVALEPRH